MLLLTGGLVPTRRMHRLTARLLLLFALVGNLVPLALAAGAAPPHACCLRKGVHRCQDSLGAGSRVVSSATRAAPTMIFAAPSLLLNGLILSRERLNPSCKPSLRGKPKPNSTPRPTSSPTSNPHALRLPAEATPILN